MPRSPSFAGLILAAGESSRMGRDKALLSWPPQIPGQTESNETFLSCAIRSFLLSTDFVVVVAGKNQAKLAPVAYANGATLAVNPDSSRGQFSSLQVGLHEVLNHGRDSALVTLVDRPPVRVATIEALLAAFASAPTRVWAVVPEFSGRHGHPYIAGRELIEAFLRATPTTSAREIEREQCDHIQYVAVDDPFVAMNVNTPEEYEALRNLKSAF
jgi:molybdenum cofactor cytidylyltransferase